ncbi:MAG: cytochrome C [Chloroflexota bacterium]
MNDQQNRLWLGLVCICLGLGLHWAGPAAPALAQSPVSEVNARCLTCHSSPDLTVRFEDGSTVSGHISSAAYDASVHGQQEMTCAGCHPHHEAFPHPAVTPGSDRAYTLAQNETCLTCHPDQAERVQDSMHAQTLAAGNTEAAVCIDCHGAHDTVSLRAARVRIATTCRKCHAGIYDDYSQSIHGQALRQENNLDVPTCVDCHGVHNIADPTTNQFRINSPNLCGQCHADEALMAKYNISTNVFETYVADFHGTTVTLFEKESPDAPTNKAVCYDCHGVHDIRSMDDPQSMAASKENLLQTCRQCHPEATINFPDSWASHFEPTFEKQPLVATVNLFYAILIPGVIGFMAFFVVTDAGRKVFGKGEQRWHGRPPNSLLKEADETTTDSPAAQAEESNE